MDAIDRRRLLTSAVLGTAGIAGATALGSLAPEAAHAAPAQLGVDPLADDPNFAEGRVTGIKDAMLLVTGSDTVLHRIQVTSGTSIWKLHPTTFEAVDVGDGLYARGVRLGDGTLAADSLWVNIVSMSVQITAIGNGWLHLDHGGSRVVGHVVPGRTAAVYRDAPTTGDLSKLRVGRHVHIIGAWRPDTNEVDLATVYAGTVAG
ncbi:MAG TPA: cell wall protein [Actinocatenispora sp.]